MTSCQANVIKTNSDEIIWNSSEKEGNAGRSILDTIYENNKNT